MDEQNQNTEAQEETVVAEFTTHEGAKFERMISGTIRISCDGVEFSLSETSWHSAKLSI